MSEATQTEAKTKAKTKAPAKTGTKAKASVATPAKARGNRRKLQGRVVNDTASEGRARKTVIVQVERRFRDKMYGKYMKARKKYHAHDEREEFRTGDLVEIREARRLSATKRWVAARLIDRPEKV